VTKRRFAALIFAAFHLGLILAGLTIFIKPGAAIFQYRIRLDPAQIKPDAGFAYRYLLEMNAMLFRPVESVLFENDRPLEKDAGNRLTEAGGGLFSLDDLGQGVAFLYFTAADNSDPRTNDHTYTLYVPIIILFRSMGLVYLVAGSLGLVGMFYLRRHEARLAALYQTTVRRLSRGDLIQNPGALWNRLFLWLILTPYLYVGLEWLFFVTKPSFMDVLSPFRRVEVLLQASFFLAVPTLLCGLSLWGLSRLPQLAGLGGSLLSLAAFLPAALLAGMALLLVDNFTYTLFRVGVVTNLGFWRGVYAVGFLLTLFYLQRQVLGAAGQRGQKPISIPHFQAWGIGGLFIFSLLMVLVRLDYGSFSGTGSMTGNPSGENRPNIILLGGDGLDAANLSAYGYERDTTPTLRELADEALVAENAFPNAAHSSGSVISILTSKLPTQTRVLYPPDVLQEKDAYQHLPGILKREGYHTVELGVDHYVDAYTMNLRDGFDLVNNRSASEAGQLQFLQGRGIDNAVYFASMLAGRIAERLGHIFFTMVMENPFDKVLAPSDHLEDESRVEQLIELINSSQDPFFVHVHMMGTHGPEFFPMIQRYSLGKTQHEQWMSDFYDDAVLSFDAHLQRVLETLKQTGKIDETIVVVYTDHGMGYRVNGRIPLIIRFPHGERAGRIQANVQNLDIAPTLLDYLGLPIPDWMVGLSLLKDDLPVNRTIFGAGAAYIEDHQLVAEQVKPPFYQFGYFNIVHCDQWYQVHVVWGHLSEGEIEGHTAPCSPDARLSWNQVKEVLVDYLSENQFDTATLP
jgi:hypothetical protein